MKIEITDLKFFPVIGTERSKAEHSLSPSDDPLVIPFRHGGLFGRQNFLIISPTECGAGILRADTDHVIDNFTLGGLGENTYTVKSDTLFGGERFMTIGIRK